MIKIIDYYIAKKMFISKIGIVSPPAGALRCFCCSSTEQAEEDSGLQGPDHADIFYAEHSIFLVLLT